MRKVVSAWKITKLLPPLHPSHSRLIALPALISKASLKAFDKREVPFLPHILLAAMNPFLDYLHLPDVPSKA